MSEYGGGIKARINGELKDESHTKDILPQIF